MKAKADKTALETALDKAVVFDNLDDKDPEDKALHDALLAGQAVEGDLNATPEQVEKATDDLNKALDAKAKQDALDELNNAIDAAKAVNKDDYKPNTVTPLEEAVKAGETAKADATKTPEELKEAAKAIKDAKDALEAKADKTALDQAITNAEDLGELNPTDAEDKAVQDALDKAKEIQDDQNANQPDVDAAKDALNKAIDAKKAADTKEAQDAAAAKQAALDALKAELAKVKALDKDTYTPNTVTPLTEKETAGQAIVDAPDAKTTDEIKAATQALKDAEAALVKRTDKGELEKAIEKANALGQLDNADAEDKAVQTAVEAGQNVKDNADATPQQVAEATKAINDAIAAKERQDALDELNKALDAAKAVNKDDYKPNTVAPLETAITAGETAKADATKTPEELKAAAKAINDAKDALQAKANKTDLNTSIQTAEGLGQLDPTDAEDKAVQDALNKAKEVQADQNANQPDVDAAKDALNKAIDAKKAQDAKDKADAEQAKQDALNELKAELEKVKSLDKTVYTPNTVTPLSEKEAAGQAIVDEPDAKTTDEIKAATQALKEAEKALVNKADKAELQKAMDKATALGQLDETDAEDKAVKDAITAGQVVKDNENATPEQVAEATKALKDAIAAKERQDALDELNKALDSAKAVNKDDFKPNTVTPLEDAVKAGEAAKADTAKTPEELKAAAKAINDAKDALQAKANKTDLNTSIQTAEGLGQLDPTDAEDKAVQDALTKAKAVQADQNADQATVDKAKTELDNAVNAKKDADAKEAQAVKAAEEAKQAALDALKAELEKAKAVNKDDYTPNSVKPLAEAEATGQTVVDNANGKTIKEIEAATQALKDAQNKLVEKANKTALEKAIETAENINTFDPGDKEDAAVLEALSNAKEVQANPNASQAAVDAASKALNDAVNAKQAQDAKEAKQAALDALKAELEKAKAVNKDDYTPNSVKPLTEAETAGQTVVDNANGKTIKEIEAATQALKDAQNKLVEKANKAALEKAIETAENINTFDPGDKEDAAVLEALSNAKEVQANPNASQAAVDAASKALNDAVNAKQAQDAKDAKAAEEALKADKSALEKAIETAENINTFDPGDKEDAAVLEALSNAKEVQADSNASQAAVDAASKALNDAVEAKQAQDAKDAKALKAAQEAKQAALDALKAELEKAKAVNKDDYTPDSVKPLTDAVTTGQAIVENTDDVSTEDIQDATKAIETALNALKGVQTTVSDDETDKDQSVTKQTVTNTSDKAVKKSEGSKAQSKPATKTNKVLPNTGQDVPVDPKYASLMFAIGGLMTLFSRRKKDEKENTEK
ncbi:hypothetical protein ACY2DA_10440 [Staphylococcus simulans]